MIEYRIISLVDAQNEDELREEESGGSVIDDTCLVALHGSQTDEEDGGEEEEAQRHPDCAPCNNFDGENFSILAKNDRREKVRV